MSGQLQLQADVCSFSLQGLGAFRSVLAILSADNLAPMALIEMEKLGAAFPVSGNYAQQAKSLLQRCSDVRLDHFALVIGWRKDDSASVMAMSAGGQAIALLSMCLMNLFKTSDVGIILARLCSKITSPSSDIASMPQMVEVAQHLSGKLNTLGFGNLLAKEVTRIDKIYRALGQETPKDLLEPLNAESMTDLLESLHRSLCQEHRICRISGCQGMGHILGLLQALFSRDTILIVEGIVIQDTEKPKVRWELLHEWTDRPTRIHLEISISTPASVQLPIDIADHKSACPIRPVPPYTFQWSGWLADWLQLNFLNYGLECNQSMLDAFCDFLILVPRSRYINATFTRQSLRAQEVPPIPLANLLGPLSRAHMCSICEDILRTTPAIAETGIQSAFAKLILVVQNALLGAQCVCTDTHDLSEGWPPKYSKPWAGMKKCILHELWRVVGQALSHGLWSFFINAGPNSTISPSYELRHDGSDATDALSINSWGSIPLSTDAIMDAMLGLISPQAWAPDGCIIASSDSSTIYPTVLADLNLPLYQMITFQLAEGRLVHERRYHRHLCAIKTTVRAPQKTRKDSSIGAIIPSHIGVHTGSPLLTVREGWNYLEVQCSFQYARTDVKVNLREVLLGYFGLRWTNMCCHPSDDPMDPSKYRPLATSVAAPSASGRLGVAMTRWSPVAQFLCCQNGYQAVVQQDCCLNCAAELLGIENCIVIIVR